MQRLRVSGRGTKTRCSQGCSASCCLCCGLSAVGEESPPFVTSQSVNLSELCVLARILSTNGAAEEVNVEFFGGTAYWPETSACLWAFGQEKKYYNYSQICLCLFLYNLQGSKKKNLNKQEMSKYLRFIVQRMKERVRRTVLSFTVLI